MLSHPPGLKLNVSLNAEEDPITLSVHRALQAAIPPEFGARLRTSPNDGSTLPRPSGSISNQQLSVRGSPQECVAQKNQITALEATKTLSIVSVERKGTPQEATTTGRELSR